MLDAAIILSLAAMAPEGAAAPVPPVAAITAPQPAADVAQPLARALPVAGAPGDPASDMAPAPAAQDASQTPPPQAAPPAITLTAPPAPAIAAPSDPLHGFNRLSWAITQPIDRFIFRPLALVYTAIIPKLLRDGIHNGLANLNAPVVFINDVLQLRFKRALHTVVRLALNSTIGVGGLFDIARRHPFSIPGHPNGFADTLGYYGVGPGPYLYLPVLGPTTLRDVIGSTGDEFAQPRLLSKMLHPDSDKPFFRTDVRIGKVTEVTFVLGGFDERSRNDDALEAIKAQSVDPYASLRSSYLQDRAGEIAALKAKDGVAPAIPFLDDPLADPAEPGVRPPAPAPGAR